MKELSRRRSSAMIAEQRAANVFRGKTARACESCVCKRARWYCAADDAFLCHGCDTSVHTANQLAGRHERVRLETHASSSKVSTSVTIDGEKKNSGASKAWYSGFTRKARTPRPSKAKSISTLPVVPEIGYEEQAVSDENEEQLLYRVPVFDPFEADICNMYIEDDQEMDQRRLLEIKSKASNHGILVNFSEFLPPISDIDLAEFASDVETLLTKSQEDDDSREKPKTVDCKGKEANTKVKEEDEDSNFGAMLDMTSCETMTWNFGYESLVTGEEEEEDYKLSAPAVGTNDSNQQGDQYNRKKNMFLRLDYEDVITSWASKRSPWTTGHRPEINPYSGWPDFLGDSTGTSTVHRSGPGLETLQVNSGGDHAGREARVSRYREKRRTRLFSKKIRYEVRKLNAESRPRMKGRFVKRTSFMEADN